MSDLFATDDDEINEALTAAIFEIFWGRGLLLPAYIGITSDCKIVMRPIYRRLCGNAHRTKN
jgi:hypothetical protein